MTEGTAETPDLLTIDEAAAILRRTPRTLRNMIYRGELQQLGAVKVGRTWMVSKPRLLHALHGTGAEVPALEGGDHAA